ncbi:hypothetical protein G7009_17935 [Pseudomonas capeferrum]|uniref:hypothetical protein n=1 Tax=Pseudomonas TaxID=286 RepID=UPI0015E3816F|nr:MULTISPECIES: hypothetical protein [Pseudomonas]MBA1203605.1 hypothetical protein [Pseudomonas capeferrum]
MKSVDVVSKAWTDTYEEIAAKAQRVREVLEQRSVKLRSGSALSQLLSQADRLSRAWADQVKPDDRVVWEAAYVNRLADAVTNLPDEQGIQEALNRMAGGVMQPDDRSDSHQGKDALWELVLLSDLKKRGFTARAAEPDIQVDFGMGDYPIACKKIWSENGVRKRVSHAAKQLAPFNNGGVIALNLDELVPVGKVLSVPTKAHAKAVLGMFNLDFIERHRSALQNAVMDGKCDGLLISTTAFAVLWEEETSAYIVSQSSMWHLEDSSQEARQRFLAFGHTQGM